MFTIGGLEDFHNFYLQQHQKDTGHKFMGMPIITDDRIPKNIIGMTLNPQAFIEQFGWRWIFRGEEAIYE